MQLFFKGHFQLIAFPTSSVAFVVPCDFCLSQLCSERGKMGFVLPHLRSTLAWPSTLNCRAATSRVRSPLARCRHQSGVVFTAYHAPGNKFERFRGFLELISRFEFEFCRRQNYFFWRIRIFGVFMWMCRGLFVPTQFHFECCGVLDGSW